MSKFKLAFKISIISKKGDNILKKAFSNIEALHTEIKNHNLSVNWEPIVNFINQNSTIKLSDFHEKMKPQ